MTARSTTVVWSVSMVAALAMLGGCTGHDGPDRDVEPGEPELAAGAAEARSPGPTGPAILVLRTRDHVITVYADGGGGARTFTIAKKDGDLVAERVDEERFRLGYPGLHEFYESAVAGGCDDGDDCPILDASVFGGH